MSAPLQITSEDTTCSVRLMSQCCAEAASSCCARFPLWFGEGIVPVRARFEGMPSPKLLQMHAYDLCMIRSASLTQGLILRVQRSKLVVIIQAEIKKQFADTGLDKATAQRVLAQWESESATDADSLKKLLRRYFILTCLGVFVRVCLIVWAS